MAGLRNAVASSSRSFPDATSRFLVISGLPRTALPRDVHAVLKQAGALGDTVGREVTVADIFKRHVDPRTTSSLLDTAFHITYPSVKAASAAMRDLRANPPFFAPTLSPDRTPGESRSRGVRIFSTNTHGPVWVRQHLEGMLSETNLGYRKEDAQAERGEGAGAGKQRVAQWRTDTRQVTNARKIAPLDDGLRGRQVLLQGLRPGMQEGALRRAMSEYDISDLDGVISLPGNAPGIATYVVTLPTVAEAHRFTRELHLTFWNNEEYDKNTGLRRPAIQAQVLW